MTQFLIDNYALVLIALVSGGFLFGPMLFNFGGSSQVNTTEAVRLINREKAVLIDVSDAKEFAIGHVAGAKNIPLADLATSTQLPKNKALPVVLLCPTGSRAPRAIPVLKKMGFENCKALAGGTAMWLEANLPIEKSSS